MTPPAAQNPAPEPHSSRSPAPKPAPLCQPGDAVSTLVGHLVQAGYTSATIEDALGPEGLNAANQSSPAAAAWHLQCRGHKDADLIAGIYLRQPLPRATWTELLGNKLTTDLESERALLPAPGNTLVSNIDIRPVAHPDESTGVRDVLVVSDPDASLDTRVPGTDHVPGVGHAPLSLLSVIPPLSAPTETPATEAATDTDNAPPRILDLGTGSGVLSHVLTTQAPDAEIIASDIHDRALAYARAADAQHAPATRPIDWRSGSWFEPVADEHFDLIISNPPFVIGPGTGATDGDLDSDPTHTATTKTQRHIYRDSGLDLDGATALVVRESAAHLAPGGRAHILAAWALKPGQTPGTRTAEWLPSHGIRAWVVQREQVDIATYVNTWLRDESIDPRSPTGQERTRAWLEYLAACGVENIGLGFVHLQRFGSDATSESPTEVHAEVIDWALPPGTYLGSDVAEWFTRAEWAAQQRADDVLGARYAVRPGVAIEEVSQADVAAGQGFEQVARRISRTEGPGFQHEIDAHIHAIVAGLHPQGLPLRDVAELYCAVKGLDDGQVTAAIVPIIVDLVRHGIVLPAELLDGE